MHWAWARQRLVDEVRPRIGSKEKPAVKCFSVAELRKFLVLLASARSYSMYHVLLFGMQKSSVESTLSPHRHPACNLRHQLVLASRLPRAVRRSATEPT